MCYMEVIERNHVVCVCIHTYVHASETMTKKMCQSVADFDAGTSGDHTTSANSFMLSLTENA